MTKNPMPFQSAPPRGGRPPASANRARGFNVSIRAPAWGATSDRPQGDQHHEVSIRAPAWGATRQRGRAGAAPNVSIRAPAWGATDRLVGIKTHNPGFNPRPRVGGDFPTMIAPSMLMLFQSAPPRGGRPAA